jgi:hypothetical protein
LGWGWVPRIHEDVLVNIAVSVLVMVLGYYGIWQTPVFLDLPVAFEKQPELLKTPVSLITEEQAASFTYQPAVLPARRQKPGIC